MDAPPTRRILIVEDDVLIALLMEELVRNLGHSVIGPMHNLNDGLDHARADEVDFALLDFDLGNGTDATPIAEALSDRAIPFAFATSSNPTVIQTLFASAPVLPKPISSSALEDVLAA